MKDKVLGLLIVSFLFFVLPVGNLIAADPGQDKGAASVQPEQPPKKLIDLTNPEEALNPDTYIKVLQMGQEWLRSHLPSIILAITILLVGRWLAMGLAGIAERSISGGKIDETLASFLSKLIYYTLLAAVVITAADQAGIKTTSFIAIFGAAGLAIGLALKDSLANFASGIMLILFRPFKVGDAVVTGGVSGTVRRIDIFSTIILTWDNQRIIVPNSSVTSGIITNINAEPTRRIDLTISIGYDDDIRLAKRVLEELVQADERILTVPAPTIAVAELADSSVNLICRPWVNTTDYGDVRFSLIEKIKLSFDEHNISFPFPQRDVHLHKEDLD